jgi:hypothetical protein
MLANWLADKLNCVPRVDKIPALMPNESEVTNKARQLATKSWFRLIDFILIIF